MQLFAAILALLVLASLVFAAGFATGSHVVRKKMADGSIPANLAAPGTTANTSW